MRSPFPLALVVAAAVATLAFVPQGARARDPARAPEPREPLRLRVLTFDVNAGFGADGELDLERTARAIGTLDPDLAALQRVDDRTARSGHVNQAMKLGELTGMHAFFGQAAEADGGRTGVAVLSKRELRMARWHRIGIVPGREPGALAEARVRLAEGGPEIVLFSTLLDWPTTDERLEQARCINRLLNERSEELQLLAGGFGDAPLSATLIELGRRWRDIGTTAPTFPAGAPSERPDTLLVRPHPRLRAIEARVIDDLVTSDHRPVLVTFEIEVQ